MQHNLLWALLLRPQHVANAWCGTARARPIPRLFSTGRTFWTPRRLAASADCGRSGALSPRPASDVHRRCSSQPLQATSSSLPSRAQRALCVVVRSRGFVVRSARGGRRGKFPSLGSCHTAWNIGRHRPSIKVGGLRLPQSRDLEVATSDVRTDRVVAKEPLLSRDASQQRIAPVHRRSTSPTGAAQPPTAFTADRYSPSRLASLDGSGGRLAGVLA